MKATDTIEVALGLRQKLNISGRVPGLQEYMEDNFEVEVRETLYSESDVHFSARSYMSFEDWISVIMSNINQNKEFVYFNAQCAAFAPSHEQKAISIVHEDSTGIYTATVPLFNEQCWAFPEYPKLEYFLKCQGEEESEKYVKELCISPSKFDPKKEGHVGRLLAFRVFNTHIFCYDPLQAKVNYNSMFYKTEGTSFNRGDEVTSVLLKKICLSL